MVPRWLIVLISFVVAAAAAQWALARDAWLELGPPLTSMAGSERQTSAPAASSLAGNMVAVGCFPGTGSDTPPAPPPYPLRVYLP